LKQWDGGWSGQMEVGTGKRRS